MSVLSAQSIVANNHPTGKVSVKNIPSLKDTLPLSSSLSSSLPVTSLPTPTTPTTPTIPTVPSATHKDIATAFLSLPVSPQPTKQSLTPTNLHHLANSIAHTGTDRSLDSYYNRRFGKNEDGEEEEEEDESESIASDVYSLLTPDLANDRTYKAQETQVQNDMIAKAAFISDVKQTLPSIISSSSHPSQVLESYFSNQIFYANNLINLSQHFINNEFTSFSHELVLNPNIPKNPAFHEEIINKLDSLYVSSVELVSVITMFNCFIKKVNYHDITLTNLKTMKSQFDYLLDNHLSQHVHEVLDTIIDALYEYNLMIEEMLDKEAGLESKTKNTTDTTGSISEKENLEIIQGYYHEIESTLTLRNDKLTQQACGKLYDFLDGEIIRNPAWMNYIDYLKTIV
ncbi:uncharacterized protein LODBEIA_P42100 [Lodderomyces beijingensis]|uniref:Uncharacterized protein n=1 Tax=Lodderomyces beijingensis TaxID=1775926 RepID=A0ABP0ZPA7_9ASCO